MSLNEENLEEMNCLRCLRMDLTGNGTMVAVVNPSVGDGVKVLEVLRFIWKDKSLSRRVNMGMFDDIVVSEVLYVL